MGFRPTQTRSRGSAARRRRSLRCDIPTSSTCSITANTGGAPYMIVEFVPGGSLAAQMKKGPLDTATALEYLEGIAAGLDYAHSLGIVHRDVKPANVLVARDGTPIIADFGLVKLLQSASLNSMTGATTGTPAYMAPEQVT